MPLVTLAEYARQHNRKPVSARAMAERGRFRTAVKHGRTWLIDDAEPYPDGRRSAQRRRSDPDAPAAPTDWPVPVNSEEAAWLERRRRHLSLVFMTGMPAYGLGSDRDLTHELTLVTRPTLDAFLFHQLGGERKARRHDATVLGLETVLERMRRGVGTCGELMLLSDDAILQADSLGRMILEARQGLLSVDCAWGVLASADRQAERAERRGDVDAMVRALILAQSVVRLAQTGRARLWCGRRDAERFRRMRNEPEVAPGWPFEYGRVRDHARRMLNAGGRLRPGLSDVEYRRLIRPVLRHALDLAR